MKKVLSIVAVAAVAATFVACGPSKEEMEAREKVKNDSIEAVNKQKTDSIAQADAAKAAEMEAMNKMKADSTRMADSVAASMTKGGKMEKKK